MLYTIFDKITLRQRSAVGKRKKTVEEAVLLLQYKPLIQPVKYTDLKISNAKKRISGGLGQRCNICQCEGII